MDGLSKKPNNRDYKPESRHKNTVIFGVLMVAALFIMGGFVALYDHPISIVGNSVPDSSSNSVTITVWGSG